MHADRYHYNFNSNGKRGWGNHGADRCFQSLLPSQCPWETRQFRCKEPSPPSSPPSRQAPWQCRGASQNTPHVKCLSTQTRLNLPHLKLQLGIHIITPCASKEKDTYPCLPPGWEGRRPCRNEMGQVQIEATRVVLNQWVTTPPGRISDICIMIQKSNKITVRG